METFEWDAASHIRTSDDVRMYLNIVLEENDPVAFLQALGTVARSAGMTQVARETGLTREGLYTSLSKKGNPSLMTIQKVLAALGLKLQVEWAEPRASQKA